MQVIVYSAAALGFFTFLLSCFRVGTWKEKICIAAALMMFGPGLIRGCDNTTSGQVVDALAPAFRPAHPRGPAAPKVPFKTKDGAVIVRRSRKPAVVRILQVKEESTPLEQGSVWGVDSVEEWSDGVTKRLRVNAYIENRGQDDILVHVNTEETYLMGVDNEELKPVGRQPMPEQKGWGRMLRRKSRMRFWLEFPEPEGKTGEMAMRLVMRGSYSIAENMFPDDLVFSMPEAVGKVAGDFGPMEEKKP